MYFCRFPKIKSSRHNVQISTIRMNRPDLIIITGSGKKVGKTFLAVSLIRHFSGMSGIIGLKISPHRHDTLGKVEMITGNENFRIYRESEVHEKNSGQYLAAGAVASCFIETEDRYLPAAIGEFMERCNPGGLPVVCESGALGTILKPGVLIFIEDPLKREEPAKEFQKRMADLVIPARSFNPLKVIAKIQLVQGNWMFHLTPPRPSPTRGGGGENGSPCSTDL